MSDNPIMKYFAYAHLPAKLQEVSKPIGELAQQMDAQLPNGPEKSAGLRKLLEAKDCLVRAALPVLAFVLALLFASDASACDRCGVFGNRCAFKQAAVHHQQQIVHAYQYPTVVNFVGAPIRIQAEITKALRDDPEYAELQRFKAWKSLATGDAVAPSLPLTGKPDLLIAKKCASCHTGDDAAGGLILDGTRAITDATYRRFSRMYVLGEKVPVKMRPLLDGLKDADGSAILAELLKLEPTPATAADSEPGELK